VVGTGFGVGILTTDPTRLMVPCIVLLALSWGGKINHRLYQINGAVVTKYLVTVKPVKTAGFVKTQLMIQLYKKKNTHTIEFMLFSIQH